ncbi:hypothetical protein [Azovibrio restrictus]|uniref:hypothetical protein n=1 Tax=Azovibrio restrictus TaxID=146938 RepID=UPI0026EDBB49|nr:hypothetical protein [Azovibrio restrictus]MDD3483552.1 hypothetical protein [Azovibrio restrictus]
MLTLILPAAGLMALGLAYRHHRQRRKQKQVAPSLMATVKRRRSLQRKLRRYLDSEVEAQAIVRAEARRLQVSPVSLEALEAALERVKSEREFPEGWEP